MLAGLFVLSLQPAHSASPTDTLPDDARAFEARCSRTWNADCEVEAQRLNILLQIEASDLASYYKKYVKIPVPYDADSLSEIRENLKGFDEEFKESCVGGWAIGCVELSNVRNTLSISEIIANSTMLGRQAEAQRIADAKAAEDARVKREADAARAAEDRRIAREQAQEQRQWKLLYLVGGVTVLLFGVFIALRAVGVSASLSEWGRFYFWLVKAAVVVSFALFLLTAVETVFGALSVPDWMRRPLADLLDKASDAIDPEAQGAPK